MQRIVHVALGFVMLVATVTAADRPFIADQANAVARVLETTGELFVCGEDADAPVIPVRWGTVVLAGDGRLHTPCPEGNHDGSHREVRERTLLFAGAASRDNEVRWRTVQVFGRLGSGLGSLLPTPRVTPACRAEVQIFGGLSEPRRWQPGELFRFLLDSSPNVRREAAFGLGTQVSREGIEADLATAARVEIQACALRPQDPVVVGLLLEAIGLARYGHDTDRAEAEQFLLSFASREHEAIVLGAVKGLEALIRRAPQRPVADATRERLRMLTQFGSRALGPADGALDARIRRLAMMALQAARDEDLLTLQRATSDADWQVRRLVAMRLNLADTAQRAIAAELERNTEFQVRYELVGAESRLAVRTRLCAPIARYLADPSPLVAMRAMDVLSAQCTDLGDVVTALVVLADAIDQSESYERWHLPSRALTALGRLRPDEARKRIAGAARHPAWQVRAAAATTAAAIGETELVTTLAGDAMPNVATAAIEGLARAKSPAAITSAITTLRSGADFQLLRAAALAIGGVAREAFPDDQRDDATEALLGAMRRLTDLGEDPSRDPRVAILGAIGRVLRAERSTDLQAFLGDFDDQVNAAAARAFTEIVGAPPAPVNPKRRYPFQPKEASLQGLPTTAIMSTDGGPVTIALRADVAPVTVARFVALAKAGYYDGLTFHRIVPNFVVQGGSPGANEYVGAARYMRDEIGPAPHLRGAVGISTRGRDTGDAQIFIDLVDVPRLDRDYTVFGYVTVGMEIVDRMLEGATIRGITFK